MRNDIVVVKYTRDEETGVESVAFEVVNGTPVASNPQDPTYQNADIRTGVFVSQKPFCRVKINGTAIESIVMLVPVKEFNDVAFSGSYNDLNNKPTSMKANGGNADTVDGKHASDLQNYNNLANKPTLGGAASQAVANNLTTNAAGSVLDARQGKALNDKIAQLNSALSGKIVSKAGNIKFSDGGDGKSYGYITIPSDCEMLAIYMQEVSSNVGLILKGFNKNSGAGGYTVWTDFTINDYAYLHWIYAKI